MIGIELDRPCGALVQSAMQKGLLISVTSEQVIRLVPPLILTQLEAEQISLILCPLVRDFLQNSSTLKTS